MTPFETAIAEIHANRTAHYLSADEEGHVKIIEAGGEPSRSTCLIFPCEKDELETILWQQCEAEAEYRFQPACSLQWAEDWSKRTGEAIHAMKAKAIRAKAMLETKVEDWQIYHHRHVYLHTGDSITAWYPPDFAYVYLEIREWGFQGGWPIDYYGIRVEFLRSMFGLPPAGSDAETNMIREAEAKLADARASGPVNRSPELNNEICRLDRLLQLLKREPMGRGHYGM